MVVATGKIKDINDNILAVRLLVLWDLVSGKLRKERQFFRSSNAIDNK